MIRQAHTYLAGALSGTALIGAAVVAFVLLVSVSALRDWPLAEIGGGGEDAAVSDGRGIAPAGTTSRSASETDAAAGVKQTGGRPGEGGAARQGVATTPGGPGGPVAQAPGPDAPASSPVGGGAGGSAPQPSSTSSGTTGGGSGGGGSGSQPGANSGGGSAPSTSGAVTGAVNETVSGVDKALGGTLGETGATTVTETTVNGVAGPESTVGQTVDEVTETVGGLLPGKR